MTFRSTYLIYSSDLGELLQSDIIELIPLLILAAFVDGRRFLNLFVLGELSGLTTLLDLREWLFGVATNVELNLGSNLTSRARVASKVSINFF